MELEQVFGYDAADPNQYRYVAYQHPHGDTWFGGYACDGGALHSPIISAYHGLEIPGKIDIEVSKLVVTGLINR